MAHSTSPIGTDIQDGGYGLPRIHILRTPVNNKGKVLGLRLLQERIRRAHNSYVG